MKILKKICMGKGQMLRDKEEYKLKGQSVDKILKFFFVKKY